MIMLLLASNGTSYAQKIYGLEGVESLNQSSLKGDSVLYLGAFYIKSNATRLYEQTKKTVYPTKVILQKYNQEKPLYVVSIPSIKNRQQLNAIKHKIYTLDDKKISSITQKRVSKSLRKIQNNDFNNKASKPVIVMLSGGVGWSNPGKTQTVYVDTDATNTYSKESNTQALGMAELFVGVEKNVFNLPVQQQWGALIGASAMARLRGEIWQFSNPSFNNMSYSYNINQLRVGFRTKWLFKQYTMINELRPYVTGSVGIGFNRSFSFNNLPNSSDIVPNPNFENKVMKAFSYSVGFGVQKNIHDNMQFGLGYELLDWGKSALAPWSGQLTNSAPTINHLYMQNLLMSLSVAIV